MWNSEVVLKAICWTFVHSLWQGLIAAIIAGLLIAVTKKTKAALRYNLLLLLFGLFVLAVTVTFINQVSGAQSSSVNTSSGILRSTPNIFLLPFSRTNSISHQDQETFIGILTSFFNEYASAIVLLWFVFFSVHSIRLFSGVLQIRQLRKSAVVSSSEWKSLVEFLSEKVGLKQTVVLMESSLANVPLTFGCVKAIILIPLGLLSNLPADQVEAVLLHELAHIRRKDYVVNLMQNMVEIIFFFNPAILWISSLIRQEREACCDDIVLAHMPQKQTYLEALVSFQEYSLIRSGSALALTHKKYYLLHRIKRMLTKENQKLNNMEKTLLLLAIMAITAFGFITKAQDSNIPLPPAATPATRAEVTQPAKPPAPATTVVLPPAPKKPKQSAPTGIIKKDTVPGIQKKNNLQRENFSSVSTKSHDDGQTKTYEVEATDNEGKTYRVKKIDDIVTEFMVDGKSIETGTEEYKEKLHQLERLERGGAQKARVEAQRKEHEKMREKFKEQREQFAKRQEEQKINHKIQRAEQEKRISSQKRQNELVMVHKALALQKQQHLENKIEVARNKKLYAGNNGEINSIINELTKNNVITTSDALSFSLNNKELIVNGKKQPANLHQSFKEKHIQKPGDYIRYSKKGGSTNITINKE